MARTNPCQVCQEVPAAEFTLAAAYPQASWFALADGSPQLVINVCEGCLLNAAYQRALQLGEIAQRDGVLEQIEQAEQLEPLGADVEDDGRPKRPRTKAEKAAEPVPASAAAPPD